MNNQFEVGAEGDIFKVKFVFVHDGKIWLWLRTKYNQAWQVKVVYYGKIGYHYNVGFALFTSGKSNLIRWKFYVTKHRGGGGSSENLTQLKLKNSHKEDME